MSLPSSYLYVYGQVENFFQRIKQGQAPEKFTQQHLKDIGFTSTNHRGFIPLLKTLGFLSSDGTPTQRYRDYRNDPLSRKIMGQAIKEAYSDIFTITSNPTEKDVDLIQGKFKSTHNTTDRNAELMTKTFYSLLELAELNTEEIRKPSVKTEKEEKKDVIEEPKKPEIQNEVFYPASRIPSLNYNIQIHLPATKDVEVYNAIFKSIKEHLID